MEATPFLSRLVTELGINGAAAAAVYVFSLIVRMRAVPIPLDNPRRRAMVAVRSFSIVLILTSAILLAHWSCVSDYERSAKTDTSTAATAKAPGDSVTDPLDAISRVEDSSVRVGSSAQKPTTDSSLKAGPEDFFGTLILLLICYSPIFIAMSRENESLASAGVNRQNLTGSIVIAAAIVMYSLISTLNERAAPVGWGVAHFWSLLRYAVVGFGEEFAWRGYLQTRLISWLGKTAGWLVVAIAFALMHFGQRTLMDGMGPGEALLDCIAIIPTSLAFGFVMLRTGSIVAPGIIHTFANWIETL